MRMRPKSAIIYLILPLLILTVTGAVAAVAPTRLQPLAAVLAVILFLLFGGAQFVVFVSEVWSERDSHSKWRIHSAGWRSLPLLS